MLFAYLYGSYAKDVAHAFSDLDVAVCVEGLDVKACLELELSVGLHIDEKLDHMVQSDVRVINHLPLVVTGRILTEGELIFISNNLGGIREFQVAVSTRFLPA